MQAFQVYFRDGINMKKVNCYSKIASLIYLALLILSLIVGFLPFVLFKVQNGVIFKVIWITIISFCILFSIFGILHHRQYLYIKGNKLVLKSLLFTIKVLDIDECYYEVARLQSYYGRTCFLENWICIYSVDEAKKFKYGFSNGRKYKRIQLTYNESNFKFVDSYVKKCNNATF